MRTKRILLIAIFVLLLTFGLLWLFSPHSYTPADVTTSAPTVVFEAGDVVLPQETQENEAVPDNYQPVAGFSNVYAVMDGDTITGYKELLDSGEFIDFDIDIPDNYEKSEGSDVIYKVLTENGEILQYRRFNGENWDIVDEDGNIIFAIPSGYVREDAEQEIYLAQTDEGTVRRQLVRFADGTYAWQTLS